MTQYEFINYEKTPNDGFQMGIVTISYMSDLLIRYKHMSKKDGSGQYFATASVSQQDAAGNRTYKDGIEIDSTRKKEELNSFLRQSVNDWHKRAEIPAHSPSVFVQTAQPQPTKTDDGVPF